MAERSSGEWDRREVEPDHSWVIEISPGTRGELEKVYGEEATGVADLTARAVAQLNREVLDKTFEAEQWGVNSYPGSVLVRPATGNLPEERMTRREDLFHRSGPAVYGSTGSRPKVVLSAQRNLRKPLQAPIAETDGKREYEVDIQINTVTEQIVDTVGVERIRYYNGEGEFKDEGRIGRALPQRISREMVVEGGGLGEPESLTLEVSQGYEDGAQVINVQAEDRRGDLVVERGEMWPRFPLDEETTRAALELYSYLDPTVRELRLWIYKGTDEVITRIEDKPRHDWKLVAVKFGESETRGLGDIDLEEGKR